MRDPAKVNIVDGIGFDPTKYVKNAAYAAAVDAVLLTLSRNLGIPYQTLYNGLFLSLGSRASGVITLTSEVDQETLVKIREAFARTTEEA